MSASPSSDLRDRLRWVGQECLVVASIAAFWIVFGLIAVALIGLMGRVLYLGGDLFQPALRLLEEPADNVDQLWFVVGALVLATTALYVVVRAGTVLIDRYQQPSV